MPTEVTKALWGGAVSVTCVGVYEGNEAHSSTLAWKIPWMEEPGRL